MDGKKNLNSDEYCERQVVLCNISVQMTTVPSPNLFIFYLIITSIGSSLNEKNNILLHNLSNN